MESRQRLNIIFLILVLILNVVWGDEAKCLTLQTGNVEVQKSAATLSIPAESDDLGDSSAGAHGSQNCDEDGCAFHHQCHFGHCSALLFSSDLQFPGTSHSHVMNYVFSHSDALMGSLKRPPIQLV